MEQIKLYTKIVKYGLISAGVIILVDKIIERDDDDGIEINE